MSNKEYGGCAMNYSGSKARFMQQLHSILPREDNLKVLDAFMGAGSLTTQLPESWSVTGNDVESRLVAIHQMAKGYLEMFGSTEFLAKKVKAFCHGYVPTRLDKEGYLRLVHDYNNHPSPLRLYALLCSSFSNQLRWNDQGNFNLPFGKRNYNPSMQKKLLQYLERVKVRDLTYTSKDFRDFDYSEYDLVIADCPYLNTTASYNEKGGWTLKDSVALLSRLDRQHVSGGKFIMFEEMWSKGKKNVALSEWASKYNIKQLGDNSDKCNYQRSGGRTQEVMIYNF